MMKKTVVFDFDGVIHSYTSGWKGVDVIPDPPVEGIREAIIDIMQDYEVHIVSTRTATPEGRVAVEKWLHDNDIPFDSLSDTKPPAVVYIDDRAICFIGKPELLKRQINRFKTWTQVREKKEKEAEYIKLDNKFLVLKREDIEKLSTDDIDKLEDIIHKIKDIRSAEGKKIDNEYVVVNRDEKYSDEVIELVMTNKED